MLPVEVLNIWACACEQASVKWFLYRETLLCAHGYHGFPEELQSVQVAVFAKDFQRITERIFPVLPADWTLDLLPFAIKNKAIRFAVNGATVLEIEVLCPVESQENVEKQLTDLNKRRAKQCRTVKCLMWIDSFFLGKLGKLLIGIYQKSVRKACNLLASFMKAQEDTGVLYCDFLTNTKSNLISRDLVEGTTISICDGYTYPVFSDYQSYLADVYGDYDNGLFDGIGCGLTAEDKTALKQHQDKCKEALAFVQQLSEEFGLRYYLLAGSVLGAVRDGGFIPWDDDVDLGIRLEDLTRFEQFVKEQLPLRLPEGFTLMQTAPNYPYPRMFSKICYNGRCCIDLWPLIPTYEKGFRATLNWCFAKLFTRSHYYKLGHPVKSMRRPAQVVGLFLNDRQILALARWNERKYLHKNTPAYINIYSIYRREKETIPREWLDAQATVDFDGIRVPVVGNTEEYLTHLYGDYMKYPAPWKRASRHVDRF